MSLPKPYWTDGQITLYKGDCRELLPHLRADSIVTDPPYGETSLEWDRWPENWPTAAMQSSRSMCCFGSLRMFMNKQRDFDGWKFAQDVVWEKHNGSSLHNDRFRRIHELAAHFYTGGWDSLHREPQFTLDAIKRQVRRKSKPPHWDGIGNSSFESEDGGPRMMTSIIFSPNCHGTAVHPTQKPENIITPLVLFSVPRGGTVLDPFGGSCTTLAVARKTGRKGIAIELREEYCQIAVDRLAQHEMFISASAP